MNLKLRQNVFRALFGISLCGVIVAWLWVMQRLVDNEGEIAQRRVDEANERYLWQLAKSFEDELKFPEEVSEDVIVALARDNIAAGVWSPKFDPVEGDRTDHEVVDGRDLKISRLIKEAREKPIADFDERLSKRVWDYRGPVLRPGFRLLLIRELEKTVTSEALVRLKQAERIRAVEGHISELDEEFEGIQSGEVTWFLSRDHLESRLQARDVNLSSKRPETGASVRIETLETWPWLSLSGERQIDREASNLSERSLWTVGLLTGGGALLLIVVAARMGTRALRQARTRTDLAASVAHELRTPLAGQRILLESMLKKEAYQPEYLEMALRENERLSGLAEEFLTFSRLERGVLSLEQKECALRDVITPVISSFSDQMGDELQGKLDLAVPAVFVDETAVATIARNLIENAWKYSDAPRKIEVEVLQTREEVGFSVSDNGIGLSQSDTARIFKQFYRVDKKLSRSQDGLGLGLAIVKRLSDAMNARLEVKSQLGEGSVFTIWFQKGETE